MQIYGGRKITIEILILQEKMQMVLLQLIKGMSRLCAILRLIGEQMEKL